MVRRKPLVRCLILLLVLPWGSAAWGQERSEIDQMRARIVELESELAPSLMSHSTSCSIWPKGNGLKSLR